MPYIIVETDTAEPKRLWVSGPVYRSGAYDPIARQMADYFLDQDIDRGIKKAPPEIEKVDELNFDLQDQVALAMKQRDLKK